jgi:hypothetical protein
MEAALKELQRLKDPRDSKRREFSCGKILSRNFQQLTREQLPPSN